ncbi:SAM-dependent methyltransferase [Saccharopolyspora lacisalsi]|uniref:SAM-dependent methyltransferase n=1 Tax=Halosaccharopolyspora lacisalsi TaxID=1000566 RepID=A0A839E4W2_9PSEU|nr:mycofactocin oligosaccharide methyltransferase MftM [Halosaccharopolyspora lacisalsi]MBA8826371.1 SAM-dependent methyltransferase [Halosaccharopolyspora lacisalsi]
MTKSRSLPIGESIDAFAADAPGYYSDGLVEVVRRTAVDRNSSPKPVTSTRHFCLRRNGDRLQVSHGMRPHDLGNELAGLLADELFAPGWLSGAEVFERVFTGVVKTTVDDPVEAWSLFYGNTLDRIRLQWSQEPREHCSSIDEIVPVYRRTSELVPEGRVLELGSCFGFLSMLLAERTNTEVIASDINAGTVELLRSMARRRGLSLGTLVCDGARVPLPDGAVDTVVAVHLLEHLEPQHGAAVLAEALRLARHKVVVAVPFETEPTMAYGHLRTFDPAALHALGLGTGHPFRTEEHHGGWLVLSRT